MTKEGFLHITERIKTLVAGGSRLSLERLSLKSNDLNDFCIEQIREIVAHCKDMKVLDICENLFLTSMKELSAMRYLYKISFKE